MFFEIKIFQDGVNNGAFSRVAGVFNQWVVYVPAAEMTWKLPISLIHTASVFQVLVTVVLVSKHLATAITLITSAIWNQKKHILNVS